MRSAYKFDIGNGTQFGILTRLLPVEVGASGGHTGAEVRVLATVGHGGVLPRDATELFLTDRLQEIKASDVRANVSILCADTFALFQKIVDVELSREQSSSSSSSAAESATPSVHVFQCCRNCHGFPLSSANLDLVSHDALAYRLHRICARENVRALLRRDVVMVKLRDWKALFGGPGL